MTNFFSQIERGFEEAAAIDGCSYFQTFTKIMLPLIKPATFSVGLLVFINCWNEYLYSLTFMSKDNMRTVPVGIALFPSNYQLPWGDMAAASIVCTLPLIALVLISRKYCCRFNNWWYERLNIYILLKRVRDNYEIYKFK